MPIIAIIDGAAGQNPLTSGQRNSAQPATSFSQLLQENRNRRENRADPTDDAQSKRGASEAGDRSPEASDREGASEEGSKKGEVSREKLNVADQSFPGDKKSGEGESAADSESQKGARAEAERSAEIKEQLVALLSNGADDASVRLSAGGGGDSGALNSERESSSRNHSKGALSSAAGKGLWALRNRGEGTGAGERRAESAQVAHATDAGRAARGGQNAGENTPLTEAEKAEIAAELEKTRVDPDNRKGRELAATESGSEGRDGSADARKQVAAAETARNEQGRKQSGDGRSRGEDPGEGKLKVVDLRAPRKGGSPQQEGGESRSDSRGGDTRGGSVLKESSELQTGESRNLGQTQETDSVFGRQLMSSAESRGNSSTGRVAQQQQLHRFLQESGYGEIVKNARMMLRENGSGEIRLNLSPKELGSVRVQLQLNDSHIAGRIIVENSTVREVVEQNLDQLHRAFQSQGLETGRLEVSVEERGDRERREGRGKGGNGGNGARIFEEHTAQVSEYFYGDTQVNLMA